MSRNVNKIGLSRFVLGFLGAFSVGIFFGDLIFLPYYYFLILALVLIFLAIICFPKKLILLILVFVIGLSLGLTSYRHFDAKEHSKNIDYAKKETIDLIVETSLTKGSYQQLIGDYKNTKILVQANLYPTYRYGDSLKVTGKIEDPSSIKINEFDYGNYLLKKQIRGLVKNPDKIEIIGWQGSRVVAAILTIGDKFQAVLNKVLPEPQSTLMIGLIIGLKQQLPDSVATAFQRSGLSHVTAVSGYNVTIVIIWIAFLLTYISRRVVFPGTILATIIFVILSGAGASVMRAGILAVLVLIGKFIGRKVYYPILILLVADLMLILNPYALKNDISFQLSFLAFIGLLVLSAPLTENRYIQNIPENFRKVLAETLGAQILVLPILIHNFGLVSIVAPVANILVLPLVPITMLIGFLTGVAGLIWLKLGLLLADVAWIFLKYILIVVESFSKFSWAAVTLKNTEWWWIPVYYLLILVYLSSFKSIKQPSHNQKE